MTSLSTNSSMSCNSSMRNGLPKGFKPSLDDVIIGRGKKIVAHNKRFLDVVATQADAYASATSRVVKSSILARVMHHVQDVKKGKFVKLDTTSGLWFVVEDSLARSTVAQALRDANSNAYRSSKQFKQRKRKQTKFGGGPKEADGSSITSSSVSGSAGRSTMGPAGLTTMVSAMDFVRASMNNKNHSVSQWQELLTMRPPPAGRNAQDVLREVLSMDTMADDIDWDQDLFPGQPTSQHQDMSSSSIRSQQDDFLALLDRTLGVEVPDTSTSNPFEPTPIAEPSFARTQAFGFARNPAPAVDCDFMDDLEDLDIREMFTSFEAC